MLVRVAVVIILGLLTIQIGPLEAISQSYYHKYVEKYSAFYLPEDENIKLATEIYLYKHGQTTNSFSAPDNSVATLTIIMAHLPLYFNNKYHNITYIHIDAAMWVHGTYVTVADALIIKDYEYIAEAYIDLFHRYLPMTLGDEYEAYREGLAAFN